MTDNPSDDEPDRSNEDSGWLSDLLTALDRFGELSASDRRRSDRSVVDYSISVRSGIDLGSAGGRRDDRRDRSRLGERPRRTRRKPPSSNRHRVTTRTAEDELLVTADVASADPGDVTVGFDGDDLVVGVGDSELERVAVPWGESTADAAVRNGVLTVTVEPAGGDGTDGPDGDEQGGDGDE